MRHPVTLIALATALVGLLAGCRGRPAPAPAADPETARAALQSALDAWKQGGPPDHLTEQSPPIYVADEDWINSFKLLHYKIQGAGQMHGSALVCPVQLKLADVKGRALEKNVVYKIGTQPTINIVRDDAPVGSDN
jgi:hypothetical protein